VSGLSPWDLSAIRELALTRLRESGRERKRKRERDRGRKEVSRKSLEKQVSALLGLLLHGR